MQYVLGLDVGIASVGWCILDEARNKIENLGVRTFVAAEEPKTGAPLAEPRRIARGARRRIRRKSHRLDRLKSVLVSRGVLTRPEMESLYDTTSLETPYDFRTRGLDEILTPDRWVRALLHIAKRRGFRSNRKSETTAEDGHMKSSIEENRQIMRQYGYRTVGEMLSKHDKFKYVKRNKAGLYINTVDRSMLEDELHALFAAQRLLGNKFADEQMENSFCKIFATQRPFASKDDIEKMVGNCIFEPMEMRAPKNAYTSERFVLLQKINNLRIQSPGGKTVFTPEQRNKIQELAYTFKEVKYEQIRKTLSLPEDWQFVGLMYYRKGEAINPEKSTFVSLRGYYSLKKVVCERLGSDSWEKIRVDTELLDKIAISLTLYKTDDDIEEWLCHNGVSSEIIHTVLQLSFDKFQHLSLKSMHKILPYLEQGLTYGDACEKAGYCHWNPKQLAARTKYLPKIKKADMNNPVVLRALSQARQVINSVIRRYGTPHRIHIEVARELAKPRSERDAISREQKNYQEMKGKLYEEFLQQFGFAPKSEDLLKYRLYREQNSCCAYSQEYLDIRRLVEPGYAEIDHIIPYSRSFDDSMANKVLVRGMENRQKGDRTPYEYFGADISRWHRFEQWINLTIKNNSKRLRLLRTHYTENDETEMKSRNLNDTRYISRYLAQMLKQHILFTDEESKNSVLMVNGQLTAYLRAKWGLTKVRDDSDRHHALDAAVLAAASTTMVRRISYYSKAKELYSRSKKGRYVDLLTGEIVETPYKECIDIDHFPQPWGRFREELVSRLSDKPGTLLAEYKIDSYTLEELETIKPIFVSRAPTRKETGPAHEETIRSKKHLHQQIKLQKIPLFSLQWDKTKEDFKQHIWGKERDWRLYEALKQRVKEHEGDVKKAFASPFYKPVIHSSEPPSLVRGVKICVTGDSGVSINGGIADNGAMIKVLVYQKDEKYYLVPVYVSDTVRATLPNKAITVKQPESQWIQIDDTFEYRFSLYPNDLVRIKTKKADILGYYKKCNRANGQMLIETHDRHKLFEEKEDRGWLITFGTIISFEKLHVDPLGNFYRSTQ